MSELLWLWKPIHIFDVICDTAFLVASDLVDTIVRLLRKSNFKVDKDKWERRLSKFCATYSTGDAEEIIRLGFKNMKTTVKLRIMKVWCVQKTHRCDDKHVDIVCVSID